MKIKHISDVDFQNYFDKNIKSQQSDTEIEQHLIECNKCAEEFSRYKKVYNTLSEINETIIPYNLSNIVMDKIKIEEKRFFKKNNLKKLMPLFISVPVILLIMFFYSSNISIPKNFVVIINSFLNPILSSLIIAKNYILSSGVNIVFTIKLIFLIVLTILTDKIILKYKHRYRIKKSI